MMSLAPIYLKKKIINFLKFPPKCFRFKNTKKVGGKHREDERFYMRGDDEPIKTKQTKETEGGGTGSECVHRITSASAGSFRFLY